MLGISKSLGEAAPGGDTEGLPLAAVACRAPCGGGAQCPDPLFRSASSQGPRIFRAEAITGRHRHRARAISTWPVRVYFLRKQSSPQTFALPPFVCPFRPGTACPELWASPGPTFLSADSVLSNSSASLRKLLAISCLSPSSPCLPHDRASEPGSRG